ncbi:DsbA family protein [Burkholderia multivorans]|uniref:DsbA family protein n=1 Tax=Burkholderia multivorans TaxID=87883 RepID=UPI001C96B02E|nr:thioredoxin domain-containing protein [Burkholderia multivorans]MBY4674362.1 DsbA family protein [Burkholderia multivorans]
MRKPSFLAFGPRSLAGVVLVVLLGLAGWWVAHHSASNESASARVSPLATEADVLSTGRAGPPWVYGRADARFTIVEYADLECPYCRAYFPVLKGWIDAHPEVNWQWQHLPLAMHEPAATVDAQIAECAGEAGGHAAFWKAVAWIYAHTRGDGQGLPPDTAYPDLNPAMQRCLASHRPDATIQAQAADAMKHGIQATPTLLVRDRQSDKTIVLPGPVEGDALLSAIDWLSDTQVRNALRKSVQ